MPKQQVSAPRGGPGSNRLRLRHTAAAWTAAFSLILTGCTGDGAGPPTGGSTSVGTGTPGTPTVVERLDLGLQIPWAAVFLPDGTAVISERDSRLLKAVRGGRSATIGELPGVVPAGEGGLLGLALSLLSLRTTCSISISRQSGTTGSPGRSSRTTVTGPTPSAPGGHLHGHPEGIHA